MSILLALQGGPQLVTVTATDRLLLRDDPVRHVGLMAADRMLLPDAPVRDEHHGQVEGLVLHEATLMAALRQAHTIDGVLLLDAAVRVAALVQTDRLFVDDRRASVVDRALLEAILLADTLGRTRELVVGEGLLIRDTATTAIEVGGAILRAVTDRLLVVDAVLREEAHVTLESTLLADRDLRDLTRVWLDRVLMADTIARSLVHTQTDRLLVAALVARLRELAVADRLGLTDRASAALVEIVEVLVFSRASTTDLLGSRATPVDLLRRQIGDEAGFPVALGLGAILVADLEHRPLVATVLTASDGLTRVVVALDGLGRQIEAVDLLTRRLWVTGLIGHA